LIFQQEDGSLATSSSRSSNSRSVMEPTGSRALRRLTHQQGLLLFSLSLSLSLSPAQNKKSDRLLSSIIYLSRVKDLDRFKEASDRSDVCGLRVWLNVTGGQECKCNHGLDSLRQEATSIETSNHGLVHPRKNRSKRQGWMDGMGWPQLRSISTSCFFLILYGTAKLTLCLQSPSTKQVHACHTLSV
jgi:hypothetical protein